MINKKELDKLYKNWEKRCQEAQKYLPRTSEGHHIISKEILEQQELKDLQIVTDYSAKREVEQVIGLDRHVLLAYYRNPDATVVTSVQINIQQISGDENLGNVEFTVELYSEHYPLCATSFCVEKGSKSVQIETDWCFVAHVPYSRLSWHVTNKLIVNENENVCIKQEPQYKILIRTIAATIGGNHCTMFNDSLVNFGKLCPDAIVFQPNNAYFYGGCIHKIE